MICCTTPRCVPLTLANKLRQRYKEKAGCSSASPAYAMGFFEIALHLLNFVAPAVFLGLLLTLAARWRRSLRYPFGASFAIISIAGCAVLAGGLAYFGNDGKMATYAAMCAVAAAVALWLSKSKGKA
jgi:hypothetical protein